MNEVALDDKRTTVNLIPNNSIKAEQKVSAGKYSVDNRRITMEK